MARWTAIVALLLGVGLTALESFQEPTLRDRPATYHLMEGGTGIPPATPGPVSSDLAR